MLTGTESVNVAALVYNSTSRPKSAKASDKVSLATSQILDEVGHFVHMGRVIMGLGLECRP